MSSEMYVTKRDGQTEIVSFDKILRRIKRIGQEAGIKINYTTLAMKVIDQLYDNISTTKIDELTADQCASMSSIHYDYATLASHITVSNHHKNTEADFATVISQLHNYMDKHGKNSPLVSKDLLDAVEANKERIAGALNFKRDYVFDYFGFKTLEKSYLMRINDKVVERPQHMWMRVSLGIHGSNIDDAIKTYDLMSQKYFTHATPTLFNAGTPRPQLSSCFLISMEKDSIEGIYNTLKDCALISKWAGGIGLHIHNIRATNSQIRGTNGTSNGIVPMLRVFNNTAKYVDQGGGKRNGSFAIYIEPWHADIEKFLEMRKNHGDEELKARDLFYALWIPDLFMNRVKTDGTWTLMCPDECPGLSDVYGEEFEALYCKYETEGKGRVTVKARDLWFKVLDAQMETGTPYLCYKDAANKKSNQKNIGIIKSSNLCVAPETLILTDKGHVQISLLENQKVNVWNGEEYSEVEVKKTGENQKLLEVKGKPNNRDEILNIQCTKYHKFYVIDEENNTKMVECQDLQIGTKLIGCKMPDSGSYDFIEIISIEPVEKLSDTFCFTEPKRHMGIFNGILTGQCSEIMEVSTPDETAVCNLASIGLPTFVENGVFNYDKLQEVASVITENLNKVIDVNYYPTEKTRVSNLRHRPIGIGVQGLADVFMLLNIPFYSNEAKEVNARIFETIYYGALSKSADLASIAGPYETYAGSPASQGQLQYDLWNITPSNHLDWSALKAKIASTGLRNSLLLAPMPTASTSQILGFNECFEPFTSNIYSRRTMAGEFVLTNKYLMKELNDMGLWNTELKNNIIANNGSIQHIQNIPDAVKLKFRTVWEIPMRHIIDMAADRGAFICQSQSLNLWQEDPNYNSLTSMHFYAWSKGLKTGMYYLRRRGKHKAQQFTIEPKKGEDCIACSA
jgi:ribonucleotide reductase alpha subunit